jgi:hypothetical protein
MGGNRISLGGLSEQVVHLSGLHSRDQGVDDGRELVLGRDDDAGLDLLTPQGAAAFGDAAHSDESIRLGS